MTTPLERLLKSWLDPKCRVTGVTPVTQAGSGTCRLQALVTHVTGEPTAEAETEAQILERQAIAEVEGGVPALYARAFAELQVGSRDDVEDERRLQAVDDAGRFLDAQADAAITLGWSADALFAPSGLILLLRGAAVVVLTATTAALSDGRVVRITSMSDGITQPVTRVTEPCDC